MTQAFGTKVWAITKTYGADASPLLFNINYAYSLSHADGEPPTADLLGVSLVEIRQNLFEGSAVAWFCDLPFPFLPFAMDTHPALEFYCYCIIGKGKGTPYLENIK